ncbi:MAG: hypothetical protein ACJ77V_00520 [Chloroflexota bacterium]
MPDGLDHIAGWEAAGLIDSTTAARLREAESVSPTTTTATGSTPDDRVAAPPTSAAARMFGPSVTVAEVFGYLGGGFLIAAWSAFMATTATSAGDANTTLAILGLLAVGVLTALAIRLRLGAEAASRAAGVVLLVALGFVSGSAGALLSGAGVSWPLLGVVASAIVVVVAVGYRLLHPSALTQVGVLASVTALAASMLVFLQESIFPRTFNETTGVVTQSGPDPIVLVIASAAWWLAIAIGLGLLGLAETRNAGDPSDPTAASRAAITRFWAGLLAVIGLATSVSLSMPSISGEFVRVLEPVVGDVALLILSAVLVERAFRREATSYIYAAALGLMVALTDINVSYLSDSASVALLVEGLILLGVGVAADRLRRRIAIAPAALIEPVTPAPEPIGPA